MYENLNTGYAATTSTLSQETTITRYSRVMMNCSNCKGRGGQACPRSRGSSPLRHDSASDHTTALSPSPRRARLLLRGKCIRIVGILLHPHLSGLANDQPERTHRRPQGPQRSTHKAPPTRALPEAINTPPGRRCSTAGTNTSSATAFPGRTGTLQKHSSMTRALYTT